MTNMNIDRRKFITAASIGAAATSIAAATATVAKADDEINSLTGGAYNQPVSTMTNWAISYLDTPSYDLAPYADGSQLEQCSESITAFNSQAYKDYRAETGDAVGFQPGRNNHMIAGDVGYSLRDFALSAGLSRELSATDDLHTDWGTDFTTDQIDFSGKWEDTPDRNALMVKHAAWYYSKCVIGIATLNRHFIYSETSEGIPITFADIETPQRTDDAYIIPESVNNVIVIGVPKDREIYKFAPTLLGQPTGTMGYCDVNVVGNRVTFFIRNLGYNAICSRNDIGPNIPFAIDAGLGELGRHGLLINPEYGSVFKLIKIFTDLPLAHDKPITFGAANFCKTCAKCAEICPSKSISFDEEPSYDTYCESNNPGMKKWYVNTWTCYDYWSECGAGCGMCAAACTYSKPKTWVHDVVKLTASKTTAFNAIFAQMDDAFGYGSTFLTGTTADDIEEWWYSEDVRNFNYKYQDEY